MLVKNIDGVFVCHWSQGGENLARWPHRACDDYRMPGAIGHLAGDFRASTVQFAHPVLAVVEFQPGGITAEDVGKKQIAARIDRTLVERRHIRDPVDIPEFGRVACGQPHVE